MRFLTLLFCVSLLLPLQAQAFTTSAQQAVILDYDTKEVLFEKDMDVTMVPSSMTKLMTLYLLFENLREGKISLETEFLVSEKAWRMGGSKMFVKVGNNVSVLDLLRGIVVQSGNDACIVVAEGLAGSEEEFARIMNKTAQRLGLKGSHFKNSTGWPDEGHVMTAHDLALLSYHLVKDFPEYYPYFAEDVFVYHNIKQHNRNRLLHKNIGVDGLKTGHTEAGGYGIAISGEDKQRGRRVIVVVNGLDSENSRESEAQKLYLYGIQQFENRKLFDNNSIIAYADVWMGEQDAVPLVPGKDISMTANISDEEEYKVEVKYTGPVTAPIKAGTQLGNMVVTTPGGISATHPLYAGKDVEEASFFTKLSKKLDYLF